MEPQIYSARQINGTNTKNASWREHRTYLMADEEFIEN